MKTWCRCDEKKDEDEDEKLSPAMLALVGKFSKQ